MTKAAWQKTRWLALLGLWVITPATGWEVVNDGGATVSSLIGQSFQPTVLGDSFSAPPRAANGLAFLRSLNFDLDVAESYPDQIFIYSAPPVAVSGQVTGTGALGVGQRGNVSYEFDPPLAVPYEGLLYVVFPSCLDVLTMADSYSAGQGLEPSGGCAAPTSTAAVVESTTDLTFSASFANPQSPLVADYRFDQSDLTSFKAGAPDLLDLGANTLVNDTVLGGNRVVMDLLSGTGVQMDMASLLSQQSYSAVMLLKVDSAAGPHKLMDVSNLTADPGVYVNTNTVEYRGDPNPPAAPPMVIDEDNYVQLTLIRSEPDGAFPGIAIGFVDGVEVFNFVDNPGIALAGAGTVVLLRDEAGENTSGSIARVRLFDGQLLPAQARVLAALPPSTTDIYESDNNAFDADVGVASGRLASYRTLHASDDIDWFYSGENCYTPNLYSAPAGLHLHSDDGRFQPIVEVYGDSFLSDTSAPPEAVYGACGESGRIQFVPGPGHFSVKNCGSVDLSSGPVAYTVTPLFPDFEVCSPISTIEGQVIDADTGQPLGGQFVLGNASSTTVSNPATGSYSLAITAGTMNLEVASQQWQGPPVQVVTQPMQSYTGINILVSQIPPPDDMPEAVADSFSGVEDVEITGDLAFNDTLSMDSPNVFSLATDATEGTAMVTSSGTFSYAPNLNSNGVDSFTYRITDVDGDEAIAQVSLTISPVNDPPTALDDSASTDDESVDLVIDVLANDSDVENDSLTIASVTQPANGAVVINGAATQLRYSPNEGYCNNGGSADSFSYWVTDGNDNAQAAVAVTVLCSADVIFSDGFET
ncbi:MAG: Ig-like domain-containing protein [Lysobacterales bacterium]